MLNEEKILFFLTCHGGFVLRSLLDLSERCMFDCPSFVGKFLSPSLFRFSSALILDFTLSDILMKTTEIALHHDDEANNNFDSCDSSSRTVA